MLYRKVEKTGDELSILGFGCMRLPQKSGTPGQGKIDEERAEKQVRTAIDQGVNYVDTALLYHMGGSESFLGRALQDGYREKVFLATKLPLFTLKIAEDMDRTLNLQLDKLNTDRIDYYLLHGLQKKSWEKMKALGALEFLEKAKADGRIVNTGFSFHDDCDTFKEIVDAYDWAICQIQYNFIDEENQAGTAGLKYAASKGLGVIIMEPLRGGFLTGKVPPAVQNIWDEADVKRSPAEWALRWVWNHPEVTAVLSGMNEEAHIEENIRIACEVQPESLTEKELSLFPRVEAAYRGLTKAGCTGCGYCMPCPAGVNIPACFDAYNILCVFDDKKMARMLYAFGLYGVEGFDPSYASLCEECGKCEKKCPQHLPVPELLKEVAEEFEDGKMKLMAWFLKRVMTFQRWGNMRRAKKLEKH